MEKARGFRFGEFGCFFDRELEMKFEGDVDGGGGRLKVLYWGVTFVFWGYFRF